MPLCHVLGKGEKPFLSNSNIQGIGKLKVHETDSSTQQHTCICTIHTYVYVVDLDPDPDCLLC